MTAAGRGVISIDFVGQGTAMGSTEVAGVVGKPNWNNANGPPKPSPKAITDVNSLKFVYNATSSAKTISLGGVYIDMKNVSYNGSITLAPYSSAVLIKK